MNVACLGGARRGVLRGSDRVTRTVCKEVVLCEFGREILERGE